MSNTLIFKNTNYNRVLTTIFCSSFTVIIWKPKGKSFIPPRKSRKYFIYWLFHYLGIFKNRDYSALLVYHNDLLIASMLIVPAHFKWPFMSKDDLQFTYVITQPEYRGKGIGEMMLRQAIKNFNKEKRTFWYVTDEKNLPSIRLCKKVGFIFCYYGFRSGILKILRFGYDDRQEEEHK